MLEGYYEHVKVAGAQSDRPITIHLDNEARTATSIHCKEPLAMPRAKARASRHGCFLDGLRLRLFTGNSKLGHSLKIFPLYD